MALSLDHITSFHAVARHGSLLAASRHLRLSQPTVGRHIDLLEAALGTRLFTRGRDGMVLTETGADLVATADELMNGIGQFQRVAAGLDEKLDGVVRLSVNEILGSLLLPRILSDFMLLHPEITFEIDVSNAASNLLKRDADIAIRMFRPQQNDLIARKVADLPMGLFAHQSYLARRPAPINLSDLKGHVLIGLDRRPALIAAYRALGLDIAPDDFAFRCDSDIAEINAVRAAIGIGPLHIGMAAHWPEIRQILPDLPVPPIELWLAYHADLRHNKRVRLVSDFLARALKTPYTALL